MIFGAVSGYLKDGERSGGTILMVGLSKEDIQDLQQGNYIFDSHVEEIIDSANLAKPVALEIVMAENQYDVAAIVQKRVKSFQPNHTPKIEIFDLSKKETKQLG